MSTTENKMDDFATTVIEYYDDNENKFNELRDAIISLNDFYLKPTERGRKQYQYDKSHQSDFQKSIIIISRAFGFVFPILKDLNDTFKASQEKIDESVEKIQQKNQTPAPYLPPNQIIVNPSERKESWTSKIKNAFSGEKVEDLPMELKDSWLMSRDLQVEIMQRKSLFKQLINWHQRGIDEAQRFVDGMDMVLKEEQDFWLETIMPDLLMMAEHGFTLAKKAKIDVIERMYGVTLQTHTAETQMQMFSGQPPK